MIRLITTRRLTALQMENEHLRTELHRVRQAAHAVLAQARLAEQARDFHQEQATFWKTRAVRFIDQAQLKAGSIESPVMGEAAAPSPSGTQRIMQALNVREIHNPPAEKMPPSAAILGVDDAAARAAVAGVLHPS